MDPAKMKVVDLRSELGALGLDTKGNKAVLVERLKKALESKTGNVLADTTILDTSTEEADDEVPATPVKPAGPAARTRRRSSTLISTPSHPTPAKMPRTTISEADEESERGRRRHVEKVQTIEDSDSNSGECILSDLPASRTSEKVSSPVSVEEESTKHEEPSSADEAMDTAEQKDEHSDEDIQLKETEAEEKENEEPADKKGNLSEGKQAKVKEEVQEEDEDKTKKETKDKEEPEEAKIKKEKDAQLQAEEEEDKAKQEERKRLLEEEEEAERKRLEEIEKDPVKRERERRRKEKRSRWSNFYRTVETTNEVLNPDLELPPEEKPIQPQQQQSIRRSRFEPEPRRKSGVKEASPVKNQPEPDQPEDKVMLSWYDSDLNQYMELPDMKFVTPISEGGFGHMWAGARATHGVKSGKVCYEVKIGATVTTTEEVTNAIRIGFSTTNSTLHLGEGELSWGYESTGRAVHSSEFKEYGKKLAEKDVVGVYLDLESSPCTLKYTVNGEDIGVAYEFEKESLNDAALFPHILTKNICYQVNLGQDKYNLLTKTKLVRRKILIPVGVILEERKQKALEFQKAHEEELTRLKEREAELEKEKKDRQREREKIKAKRDRERADRAKEREGDKDKKDGDEESSKVEEEEKDSEAVKANGGADKYDPTEAMEEDEEEAAEEEAKKEKETEEKETEEKEKEKEDEEGQDKEEVEVQAEEMEVQAEEEKDKEKVEEPSAVKEEKMEEDDAASAEDGSSEVVEESAIINTVKLDPKIKSIIRYALDEELDGEEMELLEGYTFIARVPLDQLVLGPRQPSCTGDCEVILMVGLPGSGKTYWVCKHVAAHPERRYNVLSTGALVEKMKVDCKPFRATYEGRWSAMVTKLAKCVLRLLEIAHGRTRNFILDQTNVYPSAQRRKLREFGGYKRTAVVVVPDETTYETRQKQREQADGKDIPDGAILEMKANFTLPEKCSWVEEVVFTELGEAEAQKVLDQFSKDARAAGEEREKRDKSAQRETSRPMKKSRFDSGSERGGRDRSRQDGGRRDRNNSGGRGGPRSDFRRDDRRGGGRGGGWAGAREGRGGGGAGRWGEPLRDLRDVHVGGGWGGGGGGGRPDRSESQSRWGPAGGRDGGRGGAHRSGPPDNFRGGPDNNFRSGPDNFRGGPDSNFGGRGGPGGFQPRGGRSGPSRGNDRGPPMGGRDRRPPMGGGRDGGPGRGGGHNRGGGDRGGSNQQRSGPPSLFSQGMRPMQPYGGRNNDDEPKAPSRGVPPPSGPLEKRTAGGGQEGRGGTWQRGAAAGNQHQPGRPNQNQGGGGIQGSAGMQGGGGFGQKNNPGSQQFGNRNNNIKPGGVGAGGGNPSGGGGANQQSGSQQGAANQANWNQGWNNWNQGWGQQGWGQQGWGGNWSGAAANQWNAAGNTWPSGGASAGGGAGNKGTDSNTQQWPASASQYNQWNQWPGYNWQQWPGQYNQGAQGGNTAAAGATGSSTGANAASIANAAGGGTLDTAQQQQMWAQYAQQYAQMGGYGTGTNSTASTDKK